MAANVHVRSTSPASFGPAFVRAPFFAEFAFTLFAFNERTEAG
jgi:hypothetical protein